MTQIKILLSLLIIVSVTVFTTLSAYTIIKKAWTDDNSNWELSKRVVPPTAGFIYATQYQACKLYIVISPYVWTDYKSGSCSQFNNKS